jgi:hypothetical protein
MFEFRTCRVNYTRGGAQRVIAADQSISNGDAPVTLGILLVHGIGEQRRGDTLVTWLDTIIATINRGTRRQASASVEWAELVGPEADSNSAAHAVVRITSNGMGERWVVVEGWWADAFIAPPFAQLVGWSFRAVPWALAMHAAQRFYHSSDPDAGHRWLRRAGAVLQAVVLLFLAPFIILLLALLALVGLIPSDKLRTSIGRIQRTLAATAGDSLVFLESPVRSAAMCSAVMSAFAKLDTLCRAAGCTRRVVVAHSQGATVSLEALTQLARTSRTETRQDRAGTPGLFFITLGAGINKLGALRWLSTHSGLTDEKKKPEEETLIERDPVRAACLGLLAMAGLGFWFWHLIATQQLTWTQFWAIPAGGFAASVIVGLLVTLMLRMNDRYADAYPWFRKLSIAVVVTVFAGMAIGGVAASEWYNLAVMPFYFAVMLVIALIATLRLTLSNDIQERIKKTIAPPSNVTAWRDFWATADPVPNGATLTSDANSPVGTRIWNEGSVLGDHTAYWQNRDGFVLPVVRILAREAQSTWCDALPPEHRNIDRRSRWRVAWLRTTRWLVPAAIALAVLQRASELERARASAGDALISIGIGEWLARIPHAWVPITVLGGAALLAAWIAYQLVRAFWRAWVSAEQDVLLDHNPPEGATIGLYVFGAAVLLLLAGAVYVGRTDWSTFRADWNRAELGDAASLVAVVVIWSSVIVWAVSKWFPPPTAAVTAASPQPEVEKV